jgi:hypothetical protein
MAKARPRRSPGASPEAVGRTVKRGAKAETNDASAEAAATPEVLDLDQNGVYPPQGGQDQGETDLGQHGYNQPGIAGSASQWPSAGAAGWDGDGTGVWDAATEWGTDDQVEAWEEQDGWDGGLEATWEPEEGAEEAGVWVEPDWSASGYERGYTTPYLRSRDEALATYQDYGTLERDTGWTGDVRHGPRPQQSRGNGPWPELVMITAVAVIIAAVILAVTSADRNTGAGPQASVTTLPPVTAQRAHTSAPATGKSPKSSSPPATSRVTQHSSTPTTSKSSKSKASQGAKNLAVRPGVPQSLVKSWLATNPGGVDLVPSDVAGTVVGQLYYAVQPASATYWATVVFKPSAKLLATSSTAAGQTKLAQFQNSVYVFSWKAGPVWTLLGEVSAGSCPDSWVPKSVLAVWGLCGI